jgi:hypothetical protein
MYWYTMGHSIMYWYTVGQPIIMVYHVPSQIFSWDTMYDPKILDGILCTIPEYVLVYSGSNSAMIQDLGHCECLKYIGPHARA